ncbi:MAG: superoxide dismutase family protein [Reyranellaceae bacterium]
MRIVLVAGALGLLALGASGAQAAEVTVPMHAITAAGVGAPIGSVELRDSADGLQIRTNLAGLPTGARGFHVHENPDCGPGIENGQPAAGLAAGGHYDPGHTGKHLGPTGAGHMGDLPALPVGPDGQARTNMTVKRLSVDTLRGRALMIHAGSDTYGEPPRLGGGGGRIACGVIPK